MIIFDYFSLIVFNYIYLNDYLGLDVEFFLIYVLLHMIFVFSLTDNLPEDIAIQVANFFLLALCLVLSLEIQNRAYMYYAFNESIYGGGFISIISILLIFIVFLVICLYKSYVRTDVLIGFEYLLFVSFILLGLLLVVKANNYVLLFLGIELQSLSSYVLASYKRNSLNNSEASIKYFILSGLSSSLILFGLACLYGFTGVISFNSLGQYSLGQDFNNFYFFGIFFLFCGLFFKLGLFPFHSWVPDVYSGVSWITLIVFAIVPKFIIFLVLCKFTFGLFSSYLIDFWNIIFIISGLISGLIGASGALNQSDFKRFIGYSAIGNFGYVILAFMTSTFIGLRSALAYLIIYNFQNIVFLGVCLGLRNGITYKMFRTLNLLDTVYKNNKFLSIFFVLILFSFIGLPPFSGFFVKFYIFIALIIKKYYLVVVVFLLLNCLAAVYYLVLIKKLFFNNNKNWVFILGVDVGLARIVVYCSILHVLYILYDRIFVFYLENLILGMLMNNCYNFLEYIY
jgi:NADH-quinone oxidoreductase subunit N